MYRFSIQCYINVHISIIAQCNIDQHISFTTKITDTYIQISDEIEMRISKINQYKGTFPTGRDTFRLGKKICKVNDYTFVMLITGLICRGLLAKQLASRVSSLRKGKNMRRK